MQIGDRLRFAREKIGDSQIVAAKESGTDQRTISLIENNKRDTLPLSYIQYLNSRGIDLSSLFSGKEEIFISEMEGQPIRTYDNLENFRNTQSALHKCLECKKKDETIEVLTQQLKYLQRQLSKYEKEFEETRDDASKTKLGLK